MMSDTEKKANDKRLQEEVFRRAQEELERAKMAQREAEQSQFLLQQQKSVGQKEETKPGNDGLSLLDAYKKKFPERQIKEHNGLKVLTFENPKEVRSFFEERAKAGNEFLAIECDNKFNPTGKVLLSLDGKVHECKLNESQLEALKEKYIQYEDAKDPASKAQLKAEMLEMINKSPAEDMRFSLTPGRDSSTEAASSSEEEDRPSSPSP